MSNHRGENPSTERGFALLIVLWSSVLLALLATSIVAAGRTETQLARNLREAAVLEAAADGAVYQTIFRILGDHGPLPPVALDRLSEGTVTIAIRVESLAGRVNPGVAAPEILRGLLRQVGVDRARAASLTDAIMDWATPGQRARLEGAKAPAYRLAGRPYAPPGNAMRTIDELGLVLGMTPELLAVLRPHLTVWWDNDPDPAAADPVVAAVLRDLGVEGSRGEASIQVLDITADAAASGGSRFVRHAVVKLTSLGRGERSWRLLDWSSG